MNEIDKLTEYFKEFPGIGPRQAKRFVYFLLRKNASFGKELSDLIPKIRNSIKICDICFRYFSKNIENNNTCKTCLDKNRDSSQLLVVSRDVDFEAITRSESYNGYYFILGGTIPLSENDPQKFIRIKELKDLISKRKESGLTEIILALNVTTDGDNTASFVKKEISANFPDITLSILGRGLSTGTEIEYSDRETIKNALNNRS